MSWTRLHDPHHVAGVSVHIGSVDDVPVLVIRVGRRLADDGGLSDANRFDIFAGEDSDAGRMKIVAASYGEFTRAPDDDAAFCVTLPPPPGAPQEWPPTPCDVAVEDGGVTFAAPWHDAIDLPLRLPTYAGRSAARADSSSAALFSRKVDFTFVDPVNEVATASDAALAQRGLPAGEEEESETADDAETEEEEEPNDPPLRTSRAPSLAPRRAEKEHVYADTYEGATKLTFEHNGKSCQFNKRQFAVASALYAAMVKVPGSFVDHERLMKAAGTKDLPVLQALISTIRKGIEPMGLVIGPQPKMGYWMKEDKADGQAAE